jgi:GTP pyrophosphokinase
VISAKWIDSKQEGFKATVELTGVDTMGLVNEVTRVISSNLHVNIHSLNISSDEGIFLGRIVVEIKNNNQLNQLVQKLLKIDGIEKVKRIDK